MNRTREKLLEDREIFDNELFDKIKNNPKPSILELWSLSEEKFIEWRRLNDFPNLLKLFNEKFLKFSEWKKHYKLSDEIIIKSGYITPFLERTKSKKKNIDLYLTKQNCDGLESIIVSYNKLEGKKQYLGRKYEFEFIQTFKSYQDWLSLQKLEQNILYVNSRSAVNTDFEKVYIHADVYSTKGNYELLKMGGIEIPVDQFGIMHRGKTLEFVNLSHLKLSGNIYFGENGNLSCSYCVCDNWEADNIDFALLNLDHCSVNNFTMINSKIQQWNIYDCNLSGDFFNTKLYDINIVDGIFNPILLDCKLSNTHINNLSINRDYNIEGYKTFKKLYQNQGDDDLANSYFIKENEFIRKNSKYWSFITKSLSYYYWEYGRKPHRIIYYSLVLIISFSLIYWLNSELISHNTDSKSFGIVDSLYFSTITFTTLGYGDLSPIGWLRIFSSIEAFLGAVNMGFLIAGYSNNKY